MPDNKDVVKVFLSAVEDIQEIDEIGTGAFSTVLRCCLFDQARKDSHISPGGPSACHPRPKTSFFVSEFSSTAVTSCVPAVFAVKVPNPDRGSRETLRHEARILTYLSGFCDASHHVANFHGLIECNSALVMDIYPTSLEAFATSHLRSNTDSIKIVASSCFYLAHSIFSSLKWLHNKGTIHGDIKAGNILLQTTDRPEVAGFPYNAILCDFSSAFCPRPVNGDKSLLQLPKWGGGGTWDFMSPRLFTGAGLNSDPNEDDDGYSAVMTVLWFVLGGSPYRAAQNNRIMKMEWIKRNDPMGFTMGDAEFVDRFRKVEEEVIPMKLTTWFSNGFEKGGWRKLV